MISASDAKGLKNLSYKVTSFYIFISEKLLVKVIMDNCFSFKKNDSVQQENSKPSVFAKLETARKKDKNI